jgi:hypothetical protein
VNARIANADPTTSLPQDVIGILESVIEERDRAMAKWGVQNHPDGTGGGAAEIIRDQQREIVDRQARRGESNWRDILMEEVREAFAETDPVALDKELMQVMQVCCVWREDLARRVAWADHDKRVKEALDAKAQEKVAASARDSEPF